MPKTINVKLLRKVQKFLLAEPRRFFMSVFGEGPEDIGEEYYFDNEKYRPPCGTMACIGGTAVWCEKPRVFAKMVKKNVSGDELGDAAGKLLGLTTEQASRLFYFKDWNDGEIGWPDKFEIAYENAKTPLQRAKVGVARIERFIKTNGAE